MYNSITNNKIPLKTMRLFVSEEDKLYMEKLEDYLKLCSLLLNWFSSLLIDGDNYYFNL